MDTFVNLLVFSLVVIAHASSNIQKDQEVLILTGENFGDLIDETPHVLVEFYAPWCGHCKALAPHYAEAAAQLKAEGSPILLGKVDGTVQKRLASKYDVKGFPKILFFRGDTEDYVDYTGGRNAESIVNWVKKRSSPAVTEVTSEEQLEGMLRTNKALVVGFFQDADDVPLRGFRKASDEVDEALFVYTTNQELFNVYKISKQNSVVLYKQYDHGRDEMEEELSVKQIKNFVNLNLRDIVTEYGPNSANQLFSHDDVKKHVFLFTPFDETKEKIKADFRSVAYTHKNQGYFFVMVNLAYAGNVKVLEYFDVTDRENPSLRYVDMSGNDIVKYKPDRDDISPRGIETFILGVERGFYERHYKSQPLPEDWNDGPVTVLTTENFYEIVQDEGKAVFVEFYAPWCGHCKKLEPIWEELGEFFEDREDVIIANLDATANEFPDFTIEGFPQLKYWAKGSKEAVAYEGPRELDDLKKFVEFNGNPPETESEDDSSKDEL